MKQHFVRTMKWARWTLLRATAAGILWAVSTSADAQTAYPEFYVGQATGSGLLEHDVSTGQSPSDVLGLAPTDHGNLGLPVRGQTEADGAIVLSDGLHGNDGWGLEEIGSAACGCCPGEFYVIGEMLAINREGNAGARLSQSSRLGEFGFQEGFRATIGWTSNCLDGYEMTLTHPFRWEEGTLVNGVNLQSNLIAAANFNAANLSAFNNAVFHSQRYRSELYSGEFNRRWWGWDVFSVKLGLRYINIDEEFQFRSTNNVAQTGELRVETDNHLIGPQLGIDMLRPMGRWTFQSRVVGGLFANINDQQTFFRNNGTTFVDNGSNGEEFAWMVESGAAAIYHFNDHLSARIGYEGWFVSGVAIAVEQQLNPIDLNMGNSSNVEGDIFYHGASAGFEYVW
jgi:hypothetical protein